MPSECRRRPLSFSCSLTCAPLSASTGPTSTAGHGWSIFDQELKFVPNRLRGQDVLPANFLRHLGTCTAEGRTERATGLKQHGSIWPLIEEGQVAVVVGTEVPVPGPVVEVVVRGESGRFREKSEPWRMAEIPGKDSLGYKSEEHTPSLGDICPVRSIP